MMQDQVIEIAERGKALPPDERSRLVGLQSLHEPPGAAVAAAWQVEIEARLKSCDRGEVAAIDAADVFSSATGLAR